jgi:hypothetical protein
MLLAGVAMVSGANESRRKFPASSFLKECNKWNTDAIGPQLAHIGQSGSR